MRQGFMHALVTGLFAILFSAHANAGQYNLGAAHRWLVVESRPTAREADEVAQYYIPQFPATRIFLSQNGWYAVTIGEVSSGSAEAIRSQLVDDGLIPDDSYLSQGKNFTELMASIPSDAADGQSDEGGDAPQGARSEDDPLQKWLNDPATADAIVRGLFGGSGNAATSSQDNSSNLPDVCEVQPWKCGGGSDQPPADEPAPSTPPIDPFYGDDHSVGSDGGGE